MSLRSLLSRLLAVLLPLAIASSLYLYLYPLFHGCAFPLPKTNNQTSSTTSNSLLNTILQHVAPESASDPAIFRLLVLADPQLEGDSSLPNPNNELLPRLRYHWAKITSSIEEQEPESESESESPVYENVLSAVLTALRIFAREDIPRSLRAVRKRVDLLGNDYYLAHIYRTLHWWSHPSHVTVLGDLIGSQWVTDEEFERRGSRFWERVFRGGERVEEELTVTGGDSNEKTGEVVAPLEMLGSANEKSSAWTRRIMNVAGNHDIGYAGDVSEARMERFERVFGRTNWDIRFQLPPMEQGGSGDGSVSSVVTPTLHIINLNTLTFDTPALSENVQSRTYAYLNELISKRIHPVEDRTTFTLLLTHLPLHKEEGICTDGPYFTYHENDDEKGDTDGVPRYKEGGLREQNHLSDYLSANGVLQGIFGLSGDENAAAGGRGRNGLILTGHDHTGCDVVHFVNKTDPLIESKEGEEGEEPTYEQIQSWKWNARRYDNSYNSSDSDTPSIREVTLRSMMGEFGGNAGLLSLWFDSDPAVNEWKYEITMCAAGVQHIWWVVHVIDLVAFVVLLVYLVLAALDSPKPQPKLDRAEKADSVGQEKSGSKETKDVKS
ncbi:hypothetical protein AWENTII_009866 [Aspergillus wentii]